MILPRKYKGGYSTWAGALLPISEKSRVDFGYSAMCLTEYNDIPKSPCFQVLYQTICYLYHNPYIPIMYPRKQKIETSPFSLFVFDGKIEF